MNSNRDLRIFELEERNQAINTSNQLEEMYFRKPYVETKKKEVMTYTDTESGDELECEKCIKCGNYITGLGFMLCDNCIKPRWDGRAK